MQGFWTGSRLHSASNVSNWSMQQILRALMSSRSKNVHPNGQSREHWIPWRGHIPLVRTASSDRGFRQVGHRPRSHQFGLQLLPAIHKDSLSFDFSESFFPAGLAQCFGVYQSPSAYSTTFTAHRLNPTPCSLREYGLICMSHALTVSVQGLREPPSVPCGRPV